MTKFFQLWCYYETDGVWKMEGLFRTLEAAKKYQESLWENVETPCMPDWAIIEVTGQW